MRRLTNMEWATLLYEVDVQSLNLPSWGGVIEWGGMDVLVFVGASGEVFLTDVTGEDALIAQIGRTYDPLSEYWWYHLPQETTNVLWERAEDVNAIVKTAVDVATSPSSWTLALMAGIAIIVFMQMRKA